MNCYSKDWLFEVDELNKNAVPYAMVTLVDYKGSIPQIPGAKALITEKEIIFGTLGGGKVELKAITHAKKLLEKKKSKTDFQTWNLKTDVGMTCGGVVSFYFELYNCLDFELVVFGAGHVAQALIPLLCTLDVKVTCIDSRKDWISKFEFKSNLKVIYDPEPKNQISNLNKNAFYISMTQGHSFDKPILEEIFKQGLPPFVGVIGSTSKALVLKKELLNSGVPKEKVEKIICPIGLPFGNNTPSEIAISIASQIIVEKDKVYNLKYKRWKNRSIESEISL